MVKLEDVPLLKKNKTTKISVLTQFDFLSIEIYFTSCSHYYIKCNSVIEGMF